MSARTLVAAGLVGLIVVTAGCASGSGRSSSRARSGAGEAAKGGAGGGGGARAVDRDAFRDPVKRATLREKALTYLAATAASGGPEERANAIEALQVAPARLFPVLDSALTDPVIAIRAVGAMTVGRARLDAAAGKVRPLLDDSAPQVRAAALFALHRSGERVDLTPMAALMHDPDLRVRAQTAFLLGELGEPSALGLLRDGARAPVSTASPAEVRLLDLQIAEARVKLGDAAAIQEIRAALFPARPEDLEATALACQILGQLRDRVSVNRLIVLTALQDDQKQFMPAEIRLAAAGALARLGQRQGSFIADEYRASAQDSLRAQAAFVFGETRQAENLPILADMMNDPIGRVRVAAAAAIVKATEAGDAGSVSRVP